MTALVRRLVVGLAIGGCLAGALSACAGATSCTMLSNDSGEASTYVTPLSSGTLTVTATLAPASYASPKTQRYRRILAQD